jgi:hypothetical protein
MFAKGRFVSAPIHLELGAEGLNFERADIEVYGLDQSGTSYEGRIFLNNRDANSETPTKPENGYAGSFHVYGYGIWPGDLRGNAEDEGLPSQRIRAPIQKDVVATEAVRAAAARGQDIIVTIIPVYYGNPLRDADDALKLEGVRILVR